MCDRCKTLEQVAKDASEAAQNLARQVEALQREITYLAMRNGKLKAQTERDLGEGAEAKVVIEVITYWAMTTGHTGAKISAAGKRADYVRKALRMKHSVEELKECIDGAARFPFVDLKRGIPPSMRTHIGDEKQRYDDLHTIFKDEITIGRIRALVHQPDLQPVAGSEEPSQIDLSTAEQWRRLNYPHAIVMAALWDLNAPIETPSPDEWRSTCPVHFGPGLIVRRSDAGLMSLLCSRGCEFWRLLAALGLQPSDLFENCEHDPARQDADTTRAVPAHLQEAAGILQSRLAGMQ